jgi:pyruvate-formate lyase-activating enzyme
MKDEALLKKNGGVTFSGGEPLLQTDNLLPLLSDIHKLIKTKTAVSLA